VPTPDVAVVCASPEHPVTAIAAPKISALEQRIGVVFMVVFLALVHVIKLAELFRDLFCAIRRWIHSVLTKIFGRCKNGVHDANSW
jgi:hypothetical protein